MALSTPDFLQVKTYSAKALRAALLDRAIQSGVWASGDMLVAQRAGGANMSVDLGIGSAWVLGTTSSRQGAYHVYNDAVVNVAIAANASGNPRLDQIVLHVYDSIDGGAGTDTAAIEVIQGVATAGATLDTRTGAAALPANCLRLGDVLVANGAASIVNANIRDRRSWARGYFLNSIRNNAGAYSTASTTPVVLDATNLNFRVECTGNPIRMMITGQAAHSAATSRVGIQFRVDGALTDTAALEQLSVHPTAAAVNGFCYEWTTTPAAGSHLFAPYFRAVDAGTASIRADSGTSFLGVVIEEIFRQNTANNPAGYG